MSRFTGEEVFDHIINLSAILQDAKNGQFDKKSEIVKEFRLIKQNVHAAEKLCIDAHIDQMNCVCTEFNQPVWTLRKNIIEYYYHFEKVCKNCGKTHTTTLKEWDSKRDEHPEGFEGATKAFYNLDI